MLRGRPHLHRPPAEAPSSRGPAETLSLSIYIYIMIIAMIIMIVIIIVVVIVMQMMIMIISSSVLTWSGRDTGPRPIRVIRSHVTRSLLKMGARVTLPLVRYSADSRNKISCN